MIAFECIETPGVHECREVGVFHLLDLTAGGADQMGVRQRDAFILRLHPLENMPPEHLGVYQQLDSVINCGTAHAEAVSFDDLLQFLDGEMSVDAQDALQDGIALGGPAHAMSVEILIELAHNRVVAVSKIFDI